MNYLYSYFLAIVLVGTCLSSYSQTLSRQVENSEWTLSNPSRSFHVSSMSGSSNNNGKISLDNGWYAALLGRKGSDKFGVGAIDENLQMKWNVILPGHGVAIAKFKGKILVISTADKSMFTGHSSTYLAALLDPQTGKVIQQKEIYKGSENFAEFPNFFISEKGDFFKFSVRASGLNNKNWGSIILQGYSLKIAENYGKTQSYQIFELDDNLAVSTLTPILPEGLFAGVLSNQQGDIFVLTLRDKLVLQVSQFKPGQTNPKTISHKFDHQLEAPVFNWALSKELKYIDSRIDPDRMYWALSIGSKTASYVSVAKLDFDEGTYKVESLPFTKDILKKLYEAYKSPDKKIGGPSYGFAQGLRVLQIAESKEHVFVTVSNIYRETIGQATRYYSTSPVINALTTDLKPNYQQFIPLSYITPGYDEDGYETEIFVQNDKIRFVGNKYRELLYGELEEKTGKILNFKLLSNDKLDKKSLADSRNVMWTKDGFLLVLAEPKLAIGTVKFDTHLQRYLF